MASTDRGLPDLATAIKAASESLGAALRADASGILHTRLGKLAGRLLDWSSRGHQHVAGEAEGEAFRQEAFRRLAIDLSDLVRASREADRPEPDRSEPDGSDACLDAAARLASAGETIGRLAEGRASYVPTDQAGRDPARLWSALHLTCRFLDKAVAARCQELLREVSCGEPDDTYLIPPFPELSCDGLTLAEAEQHRRLAAVIDHWDAPRRRRLEPMLSAAGICLTLLDHCDGLHGAISGHKARPIASETDRAAYQARLTETLGKLADDARPWRDQLEWLVQVDALMRAVFPLPPPAPASWWAARLRGSFECIESIASAEVSGATVVLLKAGTAVDSSDNKRYAGDDTVDIKLAGNGPGTPNRSGKVLWPLRAYLELPPAEEGYSATVQQARYIRSHSHGLPVPSAQPTI